MPHNFHVCAAFLKTVREYRNSTALWIHHWFSARCYQYLPSRSNTVNFHNRACVRTKLFVELCVILKLLILLFWSFCWTEVHFVGQIVSFVPDFGWLCSPWVSKSGWIHHHLCSFVTCAQSEMAPLDHCTHAHYFENIQAVLRMILRWQSSSHKMK